MWPFLSLTLSMSYGLFKGDLIRLCSYGTLLSKRAPMTFLIKRKQCLIAKALELNILECVWGGESNHTIFF